MRQYLIVATATWLWLAPPVAAADEAPGDVLVAMFEWWNEAMYDEEAGFTAESFAQYWTDDAVMIINGNEFGPGPAELARHFRRIQADTDNVEILLPFREGFDQGKRTFTYHYVRAITGDEVRYSRVMGVAEVRDGRLARVEFLNARIEGEPPPRDLPPAAR